MSAPHQPQESRPRESAIAEYNSLRAEMQAADSLNYQIMAITIGAIGAILSAASTQPIWSALFMCAVACVVIVLSYALLRGNRRRIWRIGTYLEVFLEPELGRDGWEIRVQAQRVQAERKATGIKPTSAIIGNEGRIARIMFLVSGIAAILFAVNAAWSAGWPRSGTWMLVVLIVLIAPLTVVFDKYVSRHERHLDRMGDVPESYRLAWKSVKELEEGGPPFNKVGPAP